MNQYASAKFENTSGKALRVIVEPWATEFTLPSGSACEVRSVGGKGKPAVEVEASNEALTFWVNTEGAVYEYWQDGERLD
jgi:hypothetical protein